MPTRTATEKELKHGKTGRCISQQVSESRRSERQAASGYGRERTDRDVEKSGGQGAVQDCPLFQRHQEVFPLNVTNWDAVVDVTSEDDSDNWPGHKLELFPTTTTMAGKLKDCIRIRPPAQRELPKQRPARPKPTKKGGAAEKLTLAEEMDDEIPFDP